VLICLILSSPWVGAAEETDGKAFRLTADQVIEEAGGAKVKATGNACATWQGVEVRADSIEADRVPGLPSVPPLKLLAKGNVSVKHKKITLRGDVLKFESASGAIDMSKVTAKLRMKGRSLSFAASQLTFNMLTHKVVAKGDVSVRVGKGKVTAERVDADLRKSKLKVFKPRVKFRLKR